MSAAWAGSIVAMVMCAITVGGLLYKSGRREGKVDELLEQLTDIAKDHEKRLRALEPWSKTERGGGRRARGERP